MQGKNDRTHRLLCVTDHCPPAAALRPSYSARPHCATPTYLVALVLSLSSMPPRTRNAAPRQGHRLHVVQEGEQVVKASRQAGRARAAHSAKQAGSARASWRTRTRTTTTSPCQPSPPASLPHASPADRPIRDMKLDSRLGGLDSFPFAGVETSEQGRAWVGVHGHGRHGRAWAGRAQRERRARRSGRERQRAAEP